MKNNECSASPFRPLSKAVTDEILGGENLVFLVAIGRGGEAVLFYPDEAEFPADDLKVSFEKVTEFLKEGHKKPPLKVTVKIPDLHAFSDETCLPEQYTTCNYQFEYHCLGFGKPCW